MEKVHHEAFAPEFELIRVLGEGAMARVYLAREVALQRLVAVKVLRPEFAADEVARARFEREARSAAGLSHPNVVEVHRVSAIDAGPYIVMEYIDGQNLADALAAGTVSREMAMEVLRGVASALRSAHEKGIVHRDVRPANVVWDSVGKRPVLTDFGIAGVLESGSGVTTKLTRAGQVLGDPAFTSPELLLGEPLSGATDVYSLGVMAYHLVAGRGPYEAASAAALASAHLRGSPIPLRQLDTHIDPPLASLLTACLAKRPEERPRIDDLIDRLEGRETHLVSSPGARGRGTQSLEAAVEHLPALKGFIEELRRRRVFNVAAVYAVVSFGLLQGGELILPALPLPDWTYSALVAAVLGLFPVALVLGWVFDLSSSGVTRSESDPRTISGPKLRLMQTVGLGLSLLVAGLIGWWILG